MVSRVLFAFFIHRVSGVVHPPVAQVAEFMERLLWFLFLGGDQFRASECSQATHAPAASLAGFLRDGGIEAFV